MYNTIEVLKLLIANPDWTAFAPNRNNFQEMKVINVQGNIELSARVDSNSNWDATHSIPNRNDWTVVTPNNELKMTEVASFGPYSDLTYLSLHGKTNNRDWFSRAIFMDETANLSPLKKYKIIVYEVQKKT